MADLCLEIHGGSEFRCALFQDDQTEVFDKLNKKNEARLVS
jgi:hypothetical protein